MRKYYLVENNQQAGPFSKDELRGRLSPNSLVWTDGMTNWEQAVSLDDLSDLFHATNQSETFPPPITPPHGNNGQSNYQPTVKFAQAKPDAGQPAGGMIAIAYLLAILGGAGGILFGSILWMGKTELNGEKVKKYSPNGQLHGAFAFFLGIVVWAICVELFLKG